MISYPRKVSTLSRTIKALLKEHQRPHAEGEVAGLFPELKKRSKAIITDTKVSSMYKYAIRRVADGVLLLLGHRWEAGVCLMQQGMHGRSARGRTKGSLSHLPLSSDLCSEKSQLLSFGSSNTNRSAYGMDRGRVTPANITSSR